MLPIRLDNIAWNMTLAEVQRLFPGGDADSTMERALTEPLPSGTVFYRLAQDVVGHPWPIFLTFTLEGDRLKAIEVQYPRKIDLRRGKMTPPSRDDGRAIHDRLYAHLVGTRGAPKDQTTNPLQSKTRGSESVWADVRGLVLLKFESTSWLNGWTKLTFAELEWAGG